jgi:hypothetical protein
LIFSLPHGNRVVQDWRRFIRAGFELPAYTPVLHISLATVGVVQGGGSARGLPLVWAYYFHDHLVRTYHLLRSFRRLDPTRLAIEPSYFLEAYGYPPHPDGVATCVQAMQAELEQIYSHLEATILPVIQTWDFEGQQANLAQWAEDLQRRFYPENTPAEIETTMPSAHLLRGYYNWQYGYEYGNGPNLPILINLRDRLASSFDQDRSASQRRRIIQQAILFERILGRRRGGFQRQVITPSLEIAQSGQSNQTDLTSTSSNERSHHHDHRSRRASDGRTKSRRHASS